MQILAIRGHNLASLSDRFEIDLQQEPLRSAGLFAITGETGAGKSTILDAMCLALYGDCPRLSTSGINDDVPDVSGETIKARDARGVLRRGASSGEAEVDFIAEDGHAYRASWGARRARGRADGRLQKPERSLVRLSDGQILESQINAVNERVVRITGLTYDEFRRTLLLAQGDFDAFLRADTADRAALLEKVTGTVVYREISRRIHAREAEAREKLETLRARHGEHATLSEEGRQQMQEESARIVAEIAEIDTVLKALVTDLQKHKDLEAAEIRLDQARKASQAATDSHAQASGDRETLAKIDIALPIRPEFDRERGARAALERAKAARAQAEQALQARNTELGTARGAADTAFAKAGDIEAQFKSFGPEWSRATKLDSQIASASDELQKADAAVRDEAKSLEAAGASLSGLERENADLEAAILQATQNLEKTPGIDQLAAKWDLVHARILERSSALKERAEAETRRTQALRDGRGARDEIGKIDHADEIARSRIIAIDEESQKTSGRLKEVETEDLNARMSRLLEARGALAELVAQMRAADEAKARLDQAETALNTASQALSAAEKDQGAAQVGAAAAQVAIQTLAAPTERAEAAASQAAAGLRLHLEDGEPCPVCGSIDHPLSEDDPLMELAREMRGELEKHRRALDEANRSITEAQSRIATFSARKEQSQKDMAGFREAVAAARSGYAEIRARDILAGLLFMLPEEPAGAGAALSEAGSALERRRQEITALIDEARELRSALEMRGQERDRLGREIESRRKEREAFSDTIGRADRSDALALQAIEGITQRVSVIDEELTPLLAPARCKPADLDMNPDTLTGKLAHLVGWWSEQTKAIEAARARLAEMAPKLSSATSEKRSIELSHGKAVAAAGERRAAHAELVRQRSELLGGEPTDAHRSRWNDARLAALQAKDDAARHLSDATGRQAAALQCRDSSIETEGEATVALESAGTSLARASHAAGLELDELARLLGLDNAVVAGLRGKLREIDDQVTRTTSALQEREADRKTLLDAGLPPMPKEEIVERVRAAESEQTARRERTGVIAGQLAADDQARARLAGLQSQIDAQKGECDTWAPVNAAVGSSSGTKFARIAQTVTLAVLVERANTHLKMLKPRYELIEGGEDLALNVIDHDMGDEIRSTRSLSGGERFLISLSLALSLSGLGRQGAIAATLFIDEGFGSLDAESLDLAIEALETLQSQGRTIGVISHVEAMKDRIPVQVMVRRSGSGKSIVEVGMAA